MDQADDESGASSSPKGVRPGALTDLLRRVAAGPATVEHQPARILPGTVIGRFEVLRELGRGGFGVVYQARDQELGREVALKVVRPGEGPAESSKVSREAEAIARLAHPNLVTLHDVGRSEHGPYLVFELLRGKTLQERIDDGPFSVQEAVHLCVEVARGLAHAHAEGVVHRDLKPSNVFLTDRGQVKILDFGMAHAFGRRRLSGGTPAYMAPEQWDDDPEDERTDVFALGVILYRLLTGGYPFPAAEGRWASGPATAPRLDIPEAPELADLLGRLLEKAPRGRPRDGEAALEALSAIEEVLRTKPVTGALAVQASRKLDAPEPPASEAPRRGRPPSWILGAGLAVALLGGAWFLARPREALPAQVPGAAFGGATTAAGPASPSPTVAVLPFADMSPGKDQEYLSDGLAEEILNVLAQVDGLRVTARTSSFSFKGKPTTAAEIGQALHVDNLLEGSVRKAGSRIRVTAQLVKAADGFHLWSKTFDRDLADVFAVQDEIAKAVAEALRATLVAGKGPLAAERRSANPEAYAQYLLGLEIRKQNDNAAGYRRAVDAYRRSLALDPAFAPAWAALSHAALAAAVTSTDATEAARHWSVAEEAADKAIALGPDLSRAYSARANVRAVHRLDWAGAEADLDRAISLNPSDAGAVSLHALTVLAPRGRFNDAVAAARRSTELDPLSARVWYRLAVAHVDAGELERGRQAALRALEINANLSEAIAVLIDVDLLAGRFAAALETCARYAGEADRESARLGIRAVTPVAGGYEGASRAALEKLVAMDRNGDGIGMAEVYAVRGEFDLAFESLERARAAKDQSLGTVGINPYLRNLHRDPRFAAFLKSLNLPLVQLP